MRRPTGQKVRHLVVCRRGLAEARGRRDSVMVTQIREGDWMTKAMGMDCAVVANDAALLNGVAAVAVKLSAEAQKVVDRKVHNHMDAMALGMVGSCWDKVDRVALGPCAVGADLAWASAPCPARAFCHRKRHSVRDCHRDARIYNDRPRCICCLFANKIDI